VDGDNSEIAGGWRLGGGCRNAEVDAMPRRFFVLYDGVGYTGAPAKPARKIYKTLIGN
jgi:hypothetical protein